VVSDAAAAIRQRYPRRRNFFQRAANQA
jgi:hypothetical protein